jgi:hypothetical protein
MVLRWWNTPKAHASPILLRHPVFRERIRLCIKRYKKTLPMAQEFDGWGYFFNTLIIVVKQFLSTPYLIQNNPSTVGTALIIIVISTIDNGISTFYNFTRTSMVISFFAHYSRKISLFLKLLAVNKTVKVTFFFVEQGRIKVVYYICTYIYGFTTWFH